jgi:hypothetical protein
MARLTAKIAQLLAQNAALADERHSLRAPKDQSIRGRTFLPTKVRENMTSSQMTCRPIRTGSKENLTNSQSLSNEAEKPSFATLCLAAQIER